VCAFADDKTDVSLEQNVDAASDAPAMDQSDVVAVEIASRDLHCLACKKLFQTPAALMRHQRRKHFGKSAPYKRPVVAAILVMTLLGL